MEKAEQIQAVREHIVKRWMCDPDVFDHNENVFMRSRDEFFEMITFGKNAVIRADSLLYEWFVQKFSDVPAQNIMDGDNLFAIESKLRTYGRRLAGENVRYLHLRDTDVTRPANIDYVITDRASMNMLYNNKTFVNALNYRSDVLAVGAYHNGKLVSLAGADDAMGTLWQIGIDTLPEFRKLGLATYLVKTLAEEIKKRGAIPFYTTWSANIASSNVAINSGFAPIWVAYQAKKV